MMKGQCNMLRPLKKVAKSVLDRYVRRVCEQEFRQQTFVRFNERPVEYAFVFRSIGQYYPRTVLDVGTGTTALPHLIRNCGALVTAIDNVYDYWPAGMINRHFHVINDDITASRIDGSFDLVTCVSVLEHIGSAADAVRNMFNVLAAHGHLVLTFPYCDEEYVENVYRLPGSSYGQGAPYITQAFSRVELNQWLSENRAIVVEQEYWQYWEGKHWTVGTQIIPPRKVERTEKHHLSCVLLRKL